MTTDDEDPLTIRDEGRAVDFRVRSHNDQTGAGFMLWRLTIQQCRGGLVPVKKCVVCQQAYPAITFIKGKDQVFHADGSSLIVDAPTCYRCEPPGDFTFTYRLHGGLPVLAMRLTLRADNGAPIRGWDEKDSVWRSMENIGLRLMTNTNHIRMQPYAERQHSKDGWKYGRGPRLPLDGDDG